MYDWLIWRLRNVDDNGGAVPRERVILRKR